MAIKSYELPKVDILNGGGVTNFLVNKGTETAQLPASLLPQILTADKLLMPDGVTSINRRLQQIGSGNLIDNADFSINQRGVTSWTSGYGLDRYRCGGLTAHAIDQGVRLVSSSTTYSNVFQIIDRSVKDGDVVTLSALTKGNNGFRLVIGRAHDSSIKAVDIPASDDWELTSVTATLSNLSKLIAKIDHPAAVAGDEIIIHRWKLEPGPFQTLAHREGNTWVLNDPPPNYALELLKCQRYFYAANAIGNSIAYFGQGTTNNTNTLVEIEVQIPNMRSYPAVSYRGSFYLESENGEKLPVTGISVFRSGVVSPILLGVKTSGTLTKGKLYRLLANDDSNARIIFDSNL